MLFKYIYVNHKVEKLQEYVEDFFKELSSLPSNTPFSLDLFHTDFKPLFENTRRDEKLKPLFEKFYNTFIKLKEEDKEVVIKNFLANNQVQDIFEDIKFNVKKLADLPVKIRKPLKELFDYLFSALNRVDFDRKEHYKEFYINQKDKVCAFCGIEDLRKPDNGQADYDHLLPKSKYPMSAANLRNLVPICKECNGKSVKGDKILIFDKVEKRRVAYYPYSEVGGITIEVTSSKVPKAETEYNFLKVIITPINSSEEKQFKTWLDIYHIQRRYDIELRNNYDNWLKELRDILIVKFESAHSIDDTLIITTVQKYKTLLDKRPYYNKYFLVSALIEFLLTKTDASFYKNLLKM